MNINSIPQSRHKFQDRVLQRNIYLISKRLADILIAAVMLVIFAPLLIMIGAWVFLSARGSIVYGHKRVGLNGKKFQCLKFCTMIPDAEKHLEDLLAKDDDLRHQWDNHRKLNPDPRVISGIGTFLRSSSLDELPQLWNILVGDMSIVGPRPVTEDELPLYGEFVGHYLSVRPGLTGPWQIGGRSNVSYTQRVQADVRYVNEASVVTDFRIFTKTVLYFTTGRLNGGS